jgi:hypothetical protein
MPSYSILSILRFELTTFSTNWGICFSLEANPNRHNPPLFGTLVAQRFEAEQLPKKQQHSTASRKTFSVMVSAFRFAAVSHSFGRARLYVLATYSGFQDGWLRSGSHPC